MSSSYWITISWYVQLNHRREINAHRDWLLPAWCLYPLVGGCQVPLTGRSSQQTIKQTSILVLWEIKLYMLCTGVFYTCISKWNTLECIQIANTISIFWIPLIHWKQIHVHSNVMYFLVNKAHSSSGLNIMSSIYFTNNVVVFKDNVWVLHRLECNTTNKYSCRHTWVRIKQNKTLPNLYHTLHVLLEHCKFMWKT